MNNRHEQNNRELLEALETLSSPRTLAVIRRTRGNVTNVAQRMQTERIRSRQGLAITLLVLAVSVLLAAPLIWSLTEVIYGNAGLTDTSILALTVFAVLLSAIMGVVLSRKRMIRG